MPARVVVEVAREEHLVCQAGIGLLTWSTVWSERSGGEVFSASRIFCGRAPDINKS
jgi:hypothetical protein